MITRRLAKWPTVPNQGRTWEIGYGWAFFAAARGVKILQGLGLAVGIGEVSAWILSAFGDDPSAANETGAAVSNATREYYAATIQDWADVAEFKVAADRRALIAPVMVLAREYMWDPFATHSDLSVAVQAVAQVVEREAAASGTPLGEAVLQDEYEQAGPLPIDPDTGLPLIEGEVVIALDPPPGSVSNLPTPSNFALAAAGPPWWLVVGLLGAGGYAWWRYGR